MTVQSKPITMKVITWLGLCIFFQMSLFTLNMTYQELTFNSLKILRHKLFYSFVENLYLHYDFQINWSCLIGNINLAVKKQTPN